MTTQRVAGPRAWTFVDSNDSRARNKNMNTQSSNDCDAAIKVLREKETRIQEMLSSAAAKQGDDIVVGLIQKQLQEYELLVAHSSNVLTAYDVQVALKKQKTLRKELEAVATRTAAVNAAARPKFSFKKKPTMVVENLWDERRENGISSTSYTPHNTSLYLLDRKDEDDIEVTFMAEASSILVNNIVNCQVHFKGYQRQQIRIHNSRDTIFMITMAEQYDPQDTPESESKIIIEDCRNLRFKFVGQHKHVHIQDFGWLKSTPSPHFSIVS